MQHIFPRYNLQEKSDKVMIHLKEWRSNQNRNANTLFRYEKSGASPGVEETGNLRRTATRRN